MKQTDTHAIYPPKRKRSIYISPGVAFLIWGIATFALVIAIGIVWAGL